MADPMKIRAQMKGDVCDIKILMSHSMENGMRKDTAGNTIPAHFIKTFSVAVNDKIVVDGQSAQSVSRNPVFGFKAKGAKVGDKVTVKWTDNKGESRTDEATVG
ncbi:MAG: thiosulfate oxidation carrier complex protein SoxZ [Rhodocyclaceae bacterium]|nr:thiosulfate oxidation carrier complex protein SoxZ [Rhodocyclaceae bacterium]